MTCLDGPLVLATLSSNLVRQKKKKEKENRLFQSFVCFKNILNKQLIKTVCKTRQRIVVVVVLKSFKTERGREGDTS